VREFSKVFWRTENERIFIGETKEKAKVGNSFKEEGTQKSVAADILGISPFKILSLLSHLLWDIPSI
jgi:hypothetical protein